MKRISTQAAIVLAVISLSDVAFGSSYVSGGLGYVVPSQSPSLTVNSSNATFVPTTPGASVFNLPNVNWKNSFNNGYELILAAGMDVNQSLRGEAELLFMSMQRSINGSYGWMQVTPIGGDVIATTNGNPISKTTSTLYSYSLIANLYYDFKNTTHWTPFVGVGAGLGRVHAGGTTGNSTLVINDVTTGLSATFPTVEHTPALNGIVFVWQFKAGVDYAVSKTVSVGAQYRRFRTSSYNINSGNITVNPGTATTAIFSTPSKAVSGLTNNSIDLIVRYNFA